MKLHPDFETFEKRYNTDGQALVWLSDSADLYTPVSVYGALCADKPKDYSFLFESVEKAQNRGRYSIIGLQPDIIWTCEGQNSVLKSISGEVLSQETQNPLTHIRAVLAESRFKVWDYPLPASSVGIFGLFGYDMIRHLEPSLPLPKQDPLNLPDSMLIRPTLTVVFDNVYDTLSIVTPVRKQSDISAIQAYDTAVSRVKEVYSQLSRPWIHQPSDEKYPVPKTTYHTTPEVFKAGVEKAKEYIKDGDIFQVVPSQRFSLEFPHSPFAFYRALRRINPSPYLFYLNLGDFQLAGSSPEILVRLQDRTLTLRPIAGTRPRGQTPEQDKALEKDLLADEKECAEHLMLLDLGRNDVGRVSQIGTVHVTDEFIIERYSHVMHIVSEVQGQLAPDYDAIDALLAGLPAGTVSGAPKIRAMEIIHDLEPVKRSFYAGGVGYFSANGDMDTCITLRTACIKDGYLYFQAGAGVVADSQAESEYQETINKAKALEKAALSLFESE